MSRLKGRTVHACTGACGCAMGAREGCTWGEGDCWDCAGDEGGVKPSLWS